MRTRYLPVLCIAFVAMTLISCGHQRINWRSLSGHEFPALTEGAVANVMRANRPGYEALKEAWAPLSAPHLSSSERLESTFAIWRWILDEVGLGSYDYAFLADCYGSGNDWGSLTKSLAKAGAEHGGDLLIVVHESWGTAQTVATSNYLGFGVFVHTPSREYQYPVFNAYLLKHVPGFDERRRRIQAMSETQLNSWNAACAKLGSPTNYATTEAYFEACDRLLPQGAQAHQ